MSGIIHINGKDYDEEGNLITPLKEKPKFVDGIAPVTTSKQINLTYTTTTINRSPQKLPTSKVHKSTTLNRLAVKKPQHTRAQLDLVNRQILKNKKPQGYSDISTIKNPNVVRAAKVESNLNSTHGAHISTKPFIPVKKTEEMILTQLENATAHLMTFKKPNIFHHVKKHYKSLPKHHRRFVLSSSSVAMALLIIGGFIFMNLPGISIMIASRKAGFTAYIPSFTPNGYSIINPIGYTTGRVVVNFKSNTNDMKYAIEQKPTGWTSDTLREQVVSSNGSQYQTQYANGLTIFFTNDDTATWVDRGILFTLQGNSGLSIDQIANIAASM